MKNLAFIFFLFLIATGNAQSIYEQSINDIDGNAIDMRSYLGKKILFFVAPVNSSDSVNLSHLNQLDSFYTRYGDTVKIIGIMSVEDGYNAANKEAIKSMYASRSINLALTAGVQTKKSSGASQSAVLQWLTDKNRNHHFNQDAGGIGHKFFVSETGRLYAALPPRASLQYQLIDRIVHSGMPMN